MSESVLLLAMFWGALILLALVYWLGWQKGYDHACAEAGRLADEAQRKIDREIAPFDREALARLLEAQKGAKT